MSVRPLSGGITRWEDANEGNLKRVGRGTLIGVFLGLVLAGCESQGAMALIVLEAPVFQLSNSIQNVGDDHANPEFNSITETVPDLADLMAQGAVGSVATAETRSVNWSTTFAT